MERYVKSPGLPENPVSSVLIGECYVELLEKSLKALNIGIIGVPQNKNVSEFISFHADISLMHLGEDVFINASGTVIDYPFKCKVFSSKPQIAKYPNEASLNAVIIGNRFIHNPKCTDTILRDKIIKSFKPIAVSQGYTKCNICIVDEISVITSDVSIARALKINGFDVLLISSGNILLPGYDTGFIGGATGKISNNKLAFTGKLDKHPDQKAILDFLKRKNVKPIFLTDDELFDVGSIIPCTETVP